LIATPILTIRIGVPAMSKPPSGLFVGTLGDIASHEAELLITVRVQGLNLEQHPLTNKQLTKKERTEINKKVNNRTATREEYKRREWNRRMNNRRRRGVRRFWSDELKRIKNGLPTTRNWTSSQIETILSGKIPKYNGKPIESHHTYSVHLYPHLADKAAIIYPATHYEHVYGWHGGNTKKSLPGRPIRNIVEM
jgi:hypothetical protein